MKDLETIGVEAIEKAIADSDVIAIDEVGPMELFSSKFKETVKMAVESGRLVVGVIHWKARDRLIDEVKARKDTEVIVVTKENRSELHETIIERAVQSLEPKSGDLQKM
jgi:nucleoside-triphosphatase